ncbi:MAG TPA: hypothetical protein VMS17_23645 [Gemmataceae bacterium]|nr:hypothetical protein [Gemmataceae bacterium]
MHKKNARYRAFWCAALLSAAALGFLAVPAALRAQSDERIARERDAPLYRYLDRAGTKLDCYFTIEEMPRETDGLSNWIEHYRVEWGEDPATIKDLLERLSGSVKGVRFQRSEDNPAVIHVIDARLEQAGKYALDRRIDLDYEGPLQPLVDLLQARYDKNLHSREVFVVGGWPGLIDDTTTKIKLTARHVSIRRILTDWLPLSKRGRILWLSESERTAGGGWDTDIQYLGGSYSEYEGPTCLPGPLVLREPVEGLDYRTAEPVINGVIPFTSGQVAYCNNPDPDKKRVRVNLVHEAVSFIDERLTTENPLQVRWAMLYLGKRKAEDGIPILLKHVDYRYTTCGLVEESYPAAKALIQIGKPAAEAAMLEVLEQDESPLRLKLLAYVANSVRGARLTRGMLQNRLEQAKDEAVKERLRHALEYCFDEGD